jgi:phosphatidylglycerol:prolipoprotein diacylglycerol transferase
VEYWQHIYEQFDPVALSLGFLNIHWYSLMYITSLLVALYMASYISKKDNLDITKDELNSYFIYAEIGVILGARLGFIIFYADNTSWYFTHPWQIFNPFNSNGDFVGIRGMSYHGALIGFLISTYIYSLKNKKQSFWFLMDLVAVSVPLGYVFGRFGNFLNKELVGKVTDVPWGIYVDSVLRHPSQLYEAFLEGIVLFLILYLYRKRKQFDGELMVLYGVGYAVARFVSEIFREPDANLGEVAFGMSMGQLLSVAMIFASIVVFAVLKDRSRRA